jgi:hypothetical protein
MIDGRSKKYTYSEQQNSRHRHQLLRQSPSMHQVRRTSNDIRRAPEQDMLQEDDGQKPIPRGRSRLFLHWQSSDEFSTHSRNV